MHTQFVKEPSVVEGTGFRFPIRIRIYSLLHSGQICPGANPVPCPNDNGGPLSVMN
jgi:hypothetical protein